VQLLQRFDGFATETVVTGDTSIIGSPIPIVVCSTMMLTWAFCATDSETNSRTWVMGEAWSSCV
jgi:Na+-translocating ferredoxin:NAD+ oxidoreductase RnfD subunit